MHLSKKNYINTYIFVFGTGQDWDDPVSCPVPSRREILSRPENFRDKNFPSQNALGRDGTAGTGWDGKI